MLVTFNRTSCRSTWNRGRWGCLGCSCWGCWGCWGCCFVHPIFPNPLFVVTYWIFLRIHKKQVSYSVDLHPIPRYHKLLINPEVIYFFLQFCLLRQFWFLRFSTLVSFDLSWLSECSKIFLGFWEHVESVSGFFWESIKSNFPTQ